MIIFPVLVGAVCALYVAAVIIVIGYGIASLVWAVRDKQAASQLARDEAEMDADVKTALAIWEELRDEPAPYWPASGLEALIASCGRCRPLGYGICWCPCDCRRPLCWGDGTLRWLPEDDDIIDGRRAL